MDAAVLAWCDWLVEAIPDLLMSHPFIDIIGLGCLVFVIRIVFSLISGKGVR